jgi:hypothetical protein
MIGFWFCFSPELSSQLFTWAVPGAVIPENSSVTIFCRIPPGVTRMKLRHAKPRDQGYYQTLQEAQEVAEFFLQHATNVSAGTYDCEYWK